MRSRGMNEGEGIKATNDREGTQILGRGGAEIAVQECYRFVARWARQTCCPQPKVQAMNAFLRLLGLTMFLGGAGMQAAPRPVRPIPEIERVVVISIDGLRPDRLLLADAPVLRSMIKGGTYTFWAKTTAVAITLPSHVSMLTGMTPNKHGIVWNTDLPFSTPVYPAFPTVFETAKLGGYTTALVTGKTKFGALTKPGTLDYVFIPEKDLKDDAFVADEAVKAIHQLKPHLLFVHFPTVDGTGHKFGWGSPEQLTAIGLADVAVGRVVSALEELGLRKSTLIIVTSDHGGQGIVHGPDDARSRYIPWIASGPGVVPGHDLTQNADLEVRTEDTACTVLYLLGAPLPIYLQGKPVLSAFTIVTK